MNQTQTIPNTKNPGTIAKIEKIQVWYFTGPEHGILPHLTVASQF